MVHTSWNSVAGRTSIAIIQIVVTDSIVRIVA
jgi:hypothetical protein